MNKVLVLTLVVVGFFVFSSAGLVEYDSTPKEISDIEIGNFMQQVSTLYQNTKRKTPHLAQATFEQYGKLDGQYAQYTISSGYSIYCGDKSNIAKMALYSFVPEKINRSLWKQEWMESYKREVAPLTGSVGLNAIQYFESIGPLSEYADKYNYKLESVFEIEDEEVYKINFSAKTAFELKGRFSKGYLIITSKDKKLISADVSGEILWSSMFHQRVVGDMRFEYVYFDNSPFLSRAETRYKKKNIEQVTVLKIDLQNFNEFEVEQNDVFDIQALAANPIVIPDERLSDRTSLGVNFKELRLDLGSDKSLIEQYKSVKGKNYWYAEQPDESNRKARATLLLVEYKELFK